MSVECLNSNFEYLSDYECSLVNVNVNENDHIMRDG